MNSINTGESKQAFALPWANNVILGNRWVQHLIFWILIILIPSLNWRAYNVSFFTEVVYNTLHLIPCILVIYLNFYYLIPRFLQKGKFLKFGLLFLLSLLIGTLLVRIVLYYGMPFLFPYTQNFPFATKPITDFYYFFYSLAAVLSIVTFSCMIKLGKMWFDKERTSQMLEKEKLRVELQFLKNQINPHFFFNTLNNLYGLTLKKSEAAPEVVLGLSSMMDYFLHESNVSFISLEKEIHILENFIALEKIRHEEGHNISFYVRGNPSAYRVAPLIFLPFVENAFKHGHTEDWENSWVNVELELQNDWIIFKVENSKPHDLISSTPKSGIGLQNVQKRLELIYKNDYDLQFFDEEDTFLVVLKINYINHED